MFQRKKTVPEQSVTVATGKPNLIAADTCGDTYVTLVDYYPGSRLDKRLEGLEANLAQVLDLLGRKLKETGNDEHFE